MPEVGAVSMQPEDEQRSVAEPASPPTRAQHAAEARLEQQIAWYDANSRHNQRWFKALKVS